MGSGVPEASRLYLQDSGSSDGTTKERPPALKTAEGLKDRADLHRRREAYQDPRSTTELLVHRVTGLRGTSDDQALRPTPNLAQQLGHAIAVEHGLEAVIVASGDRPGRQLLDLLATRRKLYPLMFDQRRQVADALRARTRRRATPKQPSSASRRPAADESRAELVRDLGVVQQLQQRRFVALRLADEQLRELPRFRTQQELGPG